MKEVLKEVLARVRLDNEEKKEIKNISSEVIRAINKRLDRKGINAQLFIGGSLAKETLMRSESIDVDIFLRFNARYSEDEMKKIFRRIFFLFRVPGRKIKMKKIHGSRDYVRIKFPKHKNLEVEIIPVVAIKKSEEARNVTDLSYFHVNYIRGKITKSKKLADEILLAKAFCHANKCYGAESYIKGFSGYALELLIIHYKSFENFLKELSHQKERVIIDIEKKYKDSSEILGKMNSSRLNSPITLVDPTYKDRNAAVSLSYETFEIFKKAAKEFIEKPSTDFFIEKRVDETEIKKKAYEHDLIYFKLGLKTNKQSGDIAGTKLLKAYGLISRQIGDYFDLVDKKFEYNEIENMGFCYFILKKKKERLIEGPSLHIKHAVENFKKVHPVWYEKNGKVYSSKPAEVKVEDFLDEFKKVHGKTFREMGITNVKTMN